MSICAAIHLVEKAIEEIEWLNKKIEQYKMVRE